MDVWHDAMLRPGDRRYPIEQAALPAFDIVLKLCLSRGLVCRFVSSPPDYLDSSDAPATVNRFGAEMADYRRA